VFPIVWTTLYVAMAFAAARVAPLQGAAYGMAFWAMQIALNTLWSPVFFGLHRIKLGFYIILPLLVAVSGTMISFFQLDVLAGVLIVPYLLWVIVALVLNVLIWKLNPDKL